MLCSTVLTLTGVKIRLRTERSVTLSEVSSTVTMTPSASSIIKLSSSVLILGRYHCQTFLAEGIDPARGTLLSIKSLIAG